MVIVGLDDGYAQTKVCWQEKCLTIPSQVQAGQPLIGALARGKTSSSATYVAEGGQWTVSDHLPAAADIHHDDYPASVEARVLATHAIRMALGAPPPDQDDSVYICSGLPLSRCVNPDENIIVRKQENLLKNDVSLSSSDDLPVPVGFSVVEHLVLAEALGAWIAQVAHINDTGQVVVPVKSADAPAAVVDIGGRTTDIVVVVSGDIDRTRSRTVQIGVSDMADVLGENIHQKLRSRPMRQQVEHALRDGVLRIFGQDHCVAELRKNAIAIVTHQLRNEVRAALGAAQDVDQVFFVGGGAKLAESVLADWFPHGVVDDDPESANARGFELFARMSHDSKFRD